MSETAKTIAFVAVGLAAVAVALLARPKSADLDTNDLVGQNLTKKFSSPDDAKRLKITRFDEDTATLRDFEVAEGEGGLWTIPSKDGYPADAKMQMAEAAMSLKDRDILGVVSESKADHELYGVIEPSTNLKPGQKGVGARVSLFDGNDDPLVDLIIGKDRKDSEGQHYVREVGRDVVYAVNVDPDKLSTSFENWIEKDLLKLDAWDLAQVELKDYSAELVAGMTPDGRFTTAIDPDFRAEMKLAYNDKDAKWQAVKMQSYDPKTKQYVDFTVAEDEELNTTSLDDLKKALDDLKIVDVVRKPEGLSADLKAGDNFLNDIEARRDLIMRGFTPTSSGTGTDSEIISSDGEVIATLKDGAEYVLRFGNLTSGPEGGKDKPAEEGQPVDKKSSDSDVHRYLFAMARFNENAVQRPELQPLPDLPKEEATKPEGEATKPEGEAASAAGKDADPQQPADDKNAAKPEAEESADPDAEKAEAKDAAEKPADAKDDAGAKDKEATDKEQEVQKIMAERKRIEDENQRKQAEYDATVAKGREKVKDLNLRFGDWYFIVDNDVFNKVRLGRNGVVKKKAAKDAAGAESATPAGAPARRSPAFQHYPAQETSGET